MAFLVFSGKILRMTFDVVRQYLEHASGSGRRSTAVSTLIVMGGVLLAGLVASVLFDAPQWLLEWLVGLVVGDAALFGIAFLYFMLKSPDALRSESFELEKMAMERGLFGDSLQGLVAQGDGPKPPAIASGPPEQIEAPE